MNTASIQVIIGKMMTTTPPAFSPVEAVEVADRHFGIDAQDVKPLVSERDQNFRLANENGTRYTLKFSNEAEQEPVIDFQNRALLHVAETDPSLPLARVIPTLDGQLHGCVEHGGKTHFVRVLSWLDGKVLHEASSDATLSNRMGQILARLGLALRDFEHPFSNPPLLWDMKLAQGLVELVEHVEQAELRQLISQTLNRFLSAVKPVLDGLRQQVIHNDLNPDNVLVDNLQTDRISGIIDFGDLTRSPLIIDLAVAAAYQLSDGEDPLAGALPMIAGYHSIRPLQDAEMALLKDLIQTRLITSLVINSYRVSLFPENREYLLTSFDSARGFLTHLSRLDTDLAFERIRTACQ